MYSGNSGVDIYRVLGKNDSREVRRFYFTGVTPTGGAVLTLANNVRHVLSNGLMVERTAGGQWHFVSNIPVDGAHISALFLSGTTLQLYVGTSTGWGGKNYRGYVDVIME